MFTRDLSLELKQLARQYPIVTVIGPRQAGKTTLVKAIFPYKAYVNLEEPATRELAGFDPKAFIAQYPNGAIFDEVQRLPQLLSYLQSIVDEREEKGLFILTGSHQLELHQAITQSLAGRTALLKLLPLSIKELAQAGIHLTLDEQLIRGGFPRIYQDHLDPTKAYSNYFQTYVERDVRQLINLKDLSLFQRFIKLCAGRIGQVLNIHSLTNELGVSDHTIKNWLSILEASFLIFRLQPYFENFGKRLIKSPKLYFTDLGLATYLLDIENVKQLERDPLRGNLFENLVVLELMKARLNRGLDPHLYYYRDNHQHEIDVIFKQGHELIPIEIKAAQTFHRQFFKGVQFFKDLTENRCPKGYLIYSGDYEQRDGLFNIINYKNSASIVEEEF